ncbi:MAG TPA: thioredoxin-like domain-containing protein [Bacteroidales bacterium]|jgi:thiol-disulfide isomerase/thioredoxin|nr:thioredoxin-like domain-containing protein [Bacteroidales bacterium]HPS71399.1 thioredoxin-like domain-containing protein [Bacteroidales bacterium]
MNISNKRIIGIFFLLLAFSIVAWAQKPKEIIIEGEAPFAANYEIRLITYTDYITYTPQKSASAKISPNGHFKLSFKANTICLAEIEINTSSAEFFLVPGYTYNFDISMDEQLFKMFNPADENGYLQIRPKTIDTNDLNLKIQKFNYYFEFLVEEYLNQITIHKNHFAFDSLEMKVKEKFPVEYLPTNYYYSYIFYTLGQLEAITYGKEPQKTFNKYLNNDFILYDNPAYMTLFNYYYDNYLYLSPRISKVVLDAAINEKCDYLMLFNAVGKDFSLVNEKLRELVIIKNLSQFIGNEEFNQDNIFKLLDYIVQNTKFSEHKIIADNLVKEVTKFDSGNNVPKFDFRYANGSKFNSKDFEGKWIYFQFFSTQCADCIREMLVIDELMKIHKDKITFVSVSVDADQTKFTQFRKRYNQFDWEFVNFNQSYEWLKSMEIYSLPEYLLFSPDGKLYSRYPPAIDQDLSLFLLRLFSEEEEETNPLDVRGGE